MTDVYRVGEILETAAGVVEERGWCRRSLVDDEGRVCAVGAIHVAAFRVWGVNGLRHEASRQAVLTLDAHVGEWCNYWNDERALDAYDVIETMKLAAKTADARAALR